LSSENIIELNGVSKSFILHHEKKYSVYEYLTSLFNRNNKTETLTVLKNISFSVKKGEMLGIIGLNGSGKTTLLKIMAKIYVPSEGHITTRGKIIPFLELGTGFNPELNAIDNIVTYGVLLGFTKNEISNRTERIAKFAELEKFMDTKLKNFSSGMYARLAFSTAIEVDPDILLVDEVLSVGDLAFQKKSFDAFTNFKRLGKTIIFVSHDIEQVRKLCDRVIFLHNGIIHSQGNPDTVIDDYKKIVSEKTG